MIEGAVIVSTNPQVGAMRTAPAVCWKWAGRESNPHSFRGGFTDRWARHMPIADPQRSPVGEGTGHAGKCTYGTQRG